MFKRKRISYISQLGSMDCGAACMTMIFNYYGLKVDIVDVGAEIHVGRDGVSLSIMKEAAEKYGFTFAAYKYEYNQISLQSKLPAVLCSGSHYVVVEKKTGNGKYVIVDPAKGRRFIEFEDIQKQYKDVLISITPAAPVRKTTNKKMNIQIKKMPFVTAGLLMLLMQLVTLYVPFIVQQVIDGISGGIQLHLLKILGIIILIVISYFGLSWIRQGILLKIDMSLFKNIIFNMIGKLFRVDINFFEWHTAGDIGNRFNNISQLNDLITNGLLNIMIQGITSVICLAVMFYSSISLTLFTVFMAVFQIMALVMINHKSLVKTREYLHTQSVLQGDLVDTLGNMIEIKCMGMDQAVSHNLMENYNKLIDSFKQKMKTSNLMICCISTVNLIFPLTIYLIGSFNISNGHMTIGSLIAYVTLVGYFTAPFTSIVMLLPSINSIKEVMLRYKELMNFHENYHIGITIQESVKTIKVENISYSYNQVNNAAIENLSLEINKGQRIALVGFSGSGKSTLVKAILGAVQIHKGNIYINEINVNEISREQIYSWFSVVTQNPMCLNMSIRKNVDITGKFSDDKIWEALSAAEVREDIEKMPLGLDTMIGESGQNISGGQRQRLAIARALISHTEVIIFDEATSNLDPITEKKIYDNLKRSKKTQIIITHRLASVRDSDKIYVLNKGKIIECGTHKELLDQKGWYYESIHNTGNY